jgi:nicotinamidase-related amidase
MIRQLVKRRRRRVLIDVNTQKDYFLADGKACIGNHRRVLTHIRRIMAWARHNSIAVISTCEVYPGGNGVNYCIDGTEGQKKIHYALLNSRISFPADGSTDLPSDLFRCYRQVILHKRSADPFEEPRIERLLSELWAGEFILVGASIERAVMSMALGLLQRGRKVTVVVDAVGSHNKREAELALRKMKAKGAKLVETKKIAGTSHLQYVGACRCPACHGQTN